MNDFFLSVTGQKQENDSIFPSLSLKERLIGFAICFALGMLFQFMSMTAILGLVVGKASRFAFLYTTGNIVSIFGTFFLIGPVRQFNNMVDPIRRYSSMIFVGSMIMTLISVYLIKSRLLVIIFVIAQFLSYLWYVASYIPYGRDCLRGIVKRLTGYEIPS